MDSRPADSACPLCHKDNRCAVTLGQAVAQCWCRNTAIPAEVKREAALQGRSCVCNDCASRLTQ